MANNREVYSFMIPIINSNMLLPNTSIVEIVPFNNVELFAGKTEAPGWYLGHLQWRGQDIPLISIDMIMGESDPQASKRSRIAITYTLNSNRSLPYMAIVVQGIPRLSHVTMDNIEVPEDEVELLSQGEKVRVTVDNVPASIPDLDKLEEMIMLAKAKILTDAHS
ncbi:MAG: chemotaxis protein CheW [Gammaproteobacteria bacterium]|nr:chemotaxis protein CheW [Gammaproteobacteria bacterium]MDH5631345.1 chemotaxis protein CheW [Gammaproteobacteria bacterium]